jgi:6-phosphogluconolactonase
MVCRATRGYRRPTARRRSGSRSASGTTCWVEVTPNGRFAYVTNTASNSISGYAVGADGSLELLDADGRTGVTGGGPIDLAITDGGRLLYTLNSGSQTISAFRIGEDGSLTALPYAPSVPAGANGLVGR